jgi:hypothetical protein
MLRAMRHTALTSYRLRGLATVPGDTPAVIDQRRRAARQRHGVELATVIGSGALTVVALLCFATERYKAGYMITLFGAFLGSITTGLRVYGEYTNDEADATDDAAAVADAAGAQ